MKIIYVIPTTQTCGGIRIAFEHGNRLIKQFGHDVCYYSEDGSMSQSWFPGFQARFINQLEDCDVIIATFWKTVYFIENNYKGNAKKFYLIQGNEPYFYDQKDVIEQVKQTYKLGYKHIVIANHLKDWLKDEFNVESDVVENGLDFCIFYPDKDYEYTQKNKEKVTILVEGNSDFYYKNVYQGLLALQGLRDKIEIWYLAYNPQNVEPKMYDKVFSRIEQDKIRKVYSCADIVLKPTLLEGSPLPIMEAMACKTAVVASNIISLKEYGVDLYNCLLSNKADINDYTKKVELLINDQELRKTIAENGFKTSARFFWDDKIKKLNDILIS